MNRKQNKQLKEILQEAISEDGDFVKELVRKILQELLEEERDLQIGVGKYVRDDSQRYGSRNGYKPRSLNTRVGKLNLRKPQIREYPFTTKLFGSYQRSEKALIVAIQQMVIDGVSTAKVKKITKKLSPELSFSKSTVSRMIKELDPMIEQWRNEQLDEHYEYIISDAIYLYVRENRQVIKRPVFISLGIDRSGHRKVLGLDIMYQEDEASWTRHLQDIKSRGVISTSLTISDANKGLVNSLNKEFSGVPHQRCFVHFIRNLLSEVPRKERRRLSQYLKHIYSSPTKEMALIVAEIIIDSYKNSYPKVSNMLNNSLEETLTFYDFPDVHRRKIRTTNLIEYINSCISRRAKVVNIFPNADSCLRYVACLLKEIDEDWQTGRRYMRMDCIKDNFQAEDEIIRRINEAKSNEPEREKVLVS